MTAVLSEVDVHSTLGVTPLSDGGCQVVVWAPHAERVEVELAESGAAHLLQRGERGYHVGLVQEMSHGSRYQLLLDGADGLPDPASRWQPEGVHGPSAVFDAAAFEWTDGSWEGVPLRDLVLYELHVGTFTPEGTLDAAAGRLTDLADLGVTAVELMPLAAFAGVRGWGYDGVDLFAVHEPYGGPAALQRFVDAAHARDIAVILDVVYNHLGPEGNYLTQYGPYFSGKHPTPWGDGVNVDDRDADEVRRFLCENARMWCHEFHIDGLRLDAVHSLVDTSPVNVFTEIADAVAEAGGRHRHLIAESDLGDVRVISPRHAGGWGMDAQWADDFHHALHALLTAERDGYYQDFGRLEDLAQAFRHGFVFRGQRSEFRRRKFGSDTHGRRPEQFVVCAQNHDQVGNRRRGERAIAALDPEHQKLALAAVVLSPFTPMLFMGDEYGETAPFPYFVDHSDPALLEAVRRGRLSEFAEFDHDGTPPDPGSEATFRSAVLNWDARSAGEQAELLEWTRRLLALRRDHPSIRAASLEDAKVLVLGDVMCVERTTGVDSTLLMLAFGAEPPVWEDMRSLDGLEVLARSARVVLTGGSPGGVQ